MYVEEKLQPSDSEYLLRGRYYKIGRFGFTYVWVNFGWQRTTVTKVELQSTRHSRYRKLK
jgi:hypothetical protein